MSDEKKPFEREDDEVLAIIEEYRKKYASEDVQDEKATPADEKPPEPKAESRSWRIFTTRPSCAHRPRSRRSTSKRT